MKRHLILNIFFLLAYSTSQYFKRWNAQFLNDDIKNKGKIFGSFFRFNKQEIQMRL